MTLFISIPWFLPAYKAGGPIQSVANLVHHVTRDINYKIICSDKDLGGEELSVDRNTWTKYNETTEVYYLENKTVLSILKSGEKIANGVLFINGIYSWQFTIAPLLFSGIPRKIVSVRGMLHPGALSQKCIKKKLFLLFWKAFRLYKRCDFHASTEQEKFYIQKIFRKSNVFVAQNFPTILPRLSNPAKKSGELYLVSVALISAMKNHLMVIRALQNCMGRIIYEIYGPVKDLDYWDRCLEEMKTLPENITVKYHGDIPPVKIPEILAKSQVFILPSKSENFGHALYEALSGGKPVITSNNTPWNRLLESHAGINTDTDEESLRSSVNLFCEMEQEQFDKFAQGSYTYARNAIDLDDIRLQYKKMFFKNGQ